MKQLLKVCVTDDIAPGGTCRYVALYESLRHRCFEVRVIQQPEGLDESHHSAGLFDFSDKAYLDVHLNALALYAELVRNGAGADCCQEAHLMRHQTS